VLGAAGAALAVWVIAVPLAGTDLTVRVNGETQSIEPGSVVTSTLIAALVGWALLAVLERVVRRPRRTWTINAIVAFAISLAGPLTSGADATTTITLIGMHLAVAAVLIPGLGRTARPGDQTATHTEPAQPPRRRTTTAPGHRGCPRG
jgi:hypothetical protein